MTCSCAFKYVRWVCLAFPALVLNRDYAEQAWGARDTAVWRFGLRSDPPLPGRQRTGAGSWWARRPDGPAAASHRGGGPGPSGAGDRCASKPGASQQASGPSCPRAPDRMRDRPGASGG